MHKVYDVYIQNGYYTTFEETDRREIALEMEEEGFDDYAIIEKECDCRDCLSLRNQFVLV